MFCVVCKRNGTFYTEMLAYLQHEQINIACLSRFHYNNAGKYAGSQSDLEIIS